MREYVPPGRAERLLDALLPFCPRPRELSVLCVGCRNTHELDLLRRAGFGDVTGIDLFSSGPDIKAMDMHATTFEDARFDVIFACHSLEHAYDVPALMTEWRRITRPSARCAIEVPVRFRKWPGREDLQDFCSTDGLAAACRPFASHMLYATESAGDPPTIRAVFSDARLSE